MKLADLEGVLDCDVAPARGRGLKCRMQWMLR